MDLKFRRNPDYQSLRDEMTPEGMFIDRRHVLSAAGFLGAGSILGALPACSEPQQTPAPVAAGAGAHPAPGAALKAKKAAYAVADQTSIEDAFTGYCNFYEFGTSKDDPPRYASLMNVSPWEVTVEGEIDRETGYVMDFGDLRRAVDEAVIRKVDRRHLNHDVDFLSGVNPTAENIAVGIWGQLTGRVAPAKLVRITLQETDRNRVVYEGGEP